MALQIFENRSLKNLCTYRIGGDARYFCSPENLDQLIGALQWSQKTGNPWMCMGKGSNVLIDDDGFPGLVIKLAGNFGNFAISKYDQTLISGGGQSLIKLGQYLIHQGWAGLEFMAVIPGTVGAAVRINAGTKEGDINCAFKAATVLSADLEVLKYSRGDMNFSYRSSNLLNFPAIVVEVEFNLEKRADPDVLKRNLQQMRLRRKAAQPRNPRTCGSVFRNPGSGQSAGWYIEQAGLKGYRFGEAMIAVEHANWIVNTGRASAAEVKALIGIAQERVWKKFNVALEREIIYVPEDIL